MHSLNIVIMIILAACFLPYIFTIIARMNAGYNPKIHDNPRKLLENSTGLAARANAVQQNSFEGLPLFLTAMLMADYLVVADIIIILFGLVYILLRVLYGLCYLANFPRLRSIFWLLATLCPVALLMLSARLYLY